MVARLCVVLVACLLVAEALSGREFDATLSPLMKQVGLTAYRTVPYQACASIPDFQIASAYVFFNSTSQAVEVMMSSAGAVDFAQLGYTAGYVNVQNELQIATRCQTQYQLTRCWFERGSNQVPLAHLPRSILVGSSSIISQRGRVTSGLCTIYIQPIIVPAKPTFYLLGVTEIRNAVGRISDWILYHLRVGYDHIVIYDDGSVDDIAGKLRPFHDLGLVTYINWTVQANATPLMDEDRQFTAMADFHIRFSRVTKVFRLRCLFGSSYN